MNNFDIKAWIPYLESPGIRMAFALTIVASVLCAILKVKKPNAKVALKITNGFLIIAITIVIGSFFVELLGIKNPATSLTDVKNGKSIQIPHDELKNAGNVQINETSINASSAQQVITGINMNGTQSNNIQIVGGNSNNVINNQGHKK